MLEPMVQGVRLVEQKSITFVIIESKFKMKISLPQVLHVILLLLQIKVDGSQQRSRNYSMKLPLINLINMLLVKKVLSMLS